MEVLRIYEHKILRFEEGLDGHEERFTESHYKAMVDYHDNKGGSKYYSLVRSGVKFSQYVGVIQIQDLTIEILPKTDRGTESQWHDVLLKMLRETRFLKLDYISEASLRYRKYSILHLYFAEYLSQLRHLIQRGLIKKYRQREGNLTALKGALLFGQHLSKNIIHKERFYTRHQVYDQQHLIHQILNEALVVVKRMVNHSSLVDEVNRIVFEFPEQQKIKVTSQVFERLKLDRKSEPYHKALEIAKMILLNYSPDIKGGNNDLFALLFDMNDLWEEYIYRQLLKSGIKVQYQNSMLFWETRLMRPDMVVSHKGKKYILDAKWKIVNDAQPSDEDLRQVFAYNIYWGVKNGFLVYPQTSLSPKTSPGRYQKVISDIGQLTCQVVYFDVIDDSRTISKVLTDSL
ncbi:McrC family protein [Marinoscillum furvescens]|uniref:5-methylcytosine-specific restriction enzyme subunit McrC n=1 Tax=Marinoscillum furvescens DSM 4134 TaxID=1122208 RepID=A0A3D9L7D4_MARFU|nr:restriction endonuclease [Marinoscillum furvescens]REE02225.1 5-methylcytosine-specific restriction enzyme subunit McrC [Marinoscillum furvescens DSM 4134]